MKKRWGFSLIKAMAVVAIIAIFASLAIPDFQGTILRIKVRKTADLIAQTILYAKSEALRRSIKTYVEKVDSDICFGTTAGACDIRRDPLISGVKISNTSQASSPFYGVPSPAPAVFTISYSGVSQTVAINIPGIVIVGAL